jgi:hypothetical protein
MRKDDFKQKELKININNITYELDKKHYDNCHLISYDDAIELMPEGRAC